MEGMVLNVYNESVQIPMINWDVFSDEESDCLSEEVGAPVDICMTDEDDDDGDDEAEVSSQLNAGCFRKMITALVGKLS